MDEYGINIRGDVTVNNDNLYDIGSPSNRIKTIYVGSLDSTTPVVAVQPTEPSDPDPGDLWFNTANNILQVRNAADDGWLGVMYGDSNNKIWMYSNTASDGWAIDAGVTDVVLALKGGSDAYNANGGTEGGTWVQPDHAHGVGAHTHSVGSISAIEWGPGDVVGSLHGGPPANTGGGTGNTDGDATAATYRPDAAIGTLQYPNSA